MKDSCQFLHRRSTGDLVCLAGINFYSVGQDREMCRVCPLADFGDIPMCENLDVYVYQRRCDNNLAIYIEAECSLHNDEHSAKRCPHCPVSERLVITRPSEVNHKLSLLVQEKV